MRAGEYGREYGGGEGTEPGRGDGGLGRAGARRYGREYEGAREGVRGRGGQKGGRA